MFEKGPFVLEQVVARLEWVLVDPSGPHAPADFVPARDAEVLVAHKLEPVAVTVVAYSAARLLRSEYALVSILQAGAAITGDATFRPGPVERQAGELLDLACRGANQTRLRRRTHQALQQLPAGQALPFVCVNLSQDHCDGSIQVHLVRAGGVG